MFVHQLSFLYKRSPPPLLLLESLVLSAHSAVRPVSFWDRRVEPRLCDDYTIAVPYVFLRRYDEFLFVNFIGKWPCFCGKETWQQLVWISASLTRMLARQPRFCILSLRRLRCFTAGILILTSLFRMFSGSHWLYFISTMLHPNVSRGWGE